MKVVARYDDGMVKVDRGFGLEVMTAEEYEALAAPVAVPPSVDGPVAEAEPGPEPPKKPAAKKRKG